MDLKSTAKRISDWQCRFGFSDARVCRDLGIDEYRLGRIREHYPISLEEAIRLSYYSGESTREIIEGDREHRRSLGDRNPLKVPVTKCLTPDTLSVPLHIMVDIESGCEDQAGRVVYESEQAHGRWFTRVLLVVEFAPHALYGFVMLRADSDEVSSDWSPAIPGEGSGLVVLSRYTKREELQCVTTYERVRT